MVVERTGQLKTTIPAWEESCKQTTTVNHLL
jgi:hypothetical protein